MKSFILCLSNKQHELILTKNLKLKIQISKMVSNQNSKRVIEPSTRILRSRKVIEKPKSIQIVQSSIVENIVNRVSKSATRKVCPTKTKVLKSALCEKENENPKSIQTVQSSVVKKIDVNKNSNGITRKVRPTKTNVSKSVLCVKENEKPKSIQTVQSSIVEKIDVNKNSNGITRKVRPTKTKVPIGKLSTDLVTQIKFQRNDICFAKITGHAPWPAQVGFFVLIFSLF